MNGTRRSLPRFICFVRPLFSLYTSSAEMFCPARPCGYVPRAYTSRPCCPRSHSTYAYNRIRECICARSRATHVRPELRGHRHAQLRARGGADGGYHHRRRGLPHLVPLATAAGRSGRRLHSDIPKTAYEYAYRRARCHTCSADASRASMIANTRSTPMDTPTHGTRAPARMGICICRMGGPQGKRISARTRAPDGLNIPTSSSYLRTRHVTHAGLHNVEWRPIQEMHMRIAPRTDRPRPRSRPAPRSGLPHR